MVKVLCKRQANHHAASAGIIVIDMILYIGIQGVYICCLELVFSSRHLYAQCQEQAYNCCYTYLHNPLKNNYIMVVGGVDSMFLLCKLDGNSMQIRCKFDGKISEYRI